MNYTIRKATDEDVDKVIDLAVEMVLHSISPFRDVTGEKVQEFRREDLIVLRDISTYNNIAIFLAEDENKSFIGHVIVVGGDVESSTGEKQGWIFDLSVKKEYWNKGIGQELMKYAEEFIKNLGLKYIGLGVTSSNSRAVRFYENLGYEEERKRMIKKIK